MSLLVDDLLLLARLDQGRPLAREAGRPGPDRRRRGRCDAHLDDRDRPITLAIDARPRRGAATTRPPAPDRRQPPAQRRGAHPAATPVHVDVAPATGATAVVRVADEGPGLDAEQATRVFDRFYRGSEARTGEGTGPGTVDRGRPGRSPRWHVPGRHRPGRGCGVHRRDPAAEPDDGRDGPPPGPAPAAPSATPTRRPRAADAGDEDLAPAVRR